MSKNHGRRILIDGREARDLTRSELYDVIWGAAIRLDLSGTAITLLSRDEAKARAKARVFDRNCDVEQRARA